MVLQVPWSNFADEVASRCGPSSKIYLDIHQGKTVATAADPRQNLIVQASSPLSVQQARTELAHHKFQTALGHWSPQDPDLIPAEASIAAVSYLSNEETPGIWIEAFPTKPNPSEVLTTIIDEFTEEGSLRNITPNTFKDQAKPNILILTQHELQHMLENHVTNAATKSKSPVQDQSVSTENTPSIEAETPIKEEDSDQTEATPSEDQP